jgi:hypothetical protein
VTAPTGVPDVDLLALFPKAGTDPFARRAGIAHVRNGVFVDSQGRSIKLQGRGRLTGNTYVRTGRVRSIQESCEVDSQYDELEERGAIYRYSKADDGSSPLGVNHVLISVQHLVSDAELNSRIEDAEIISEVPIRGFVTVNHQRTSRGSHLTLDGLTFQPSRTISGAVVQRAIVEFDAEKLMVSKAGLQLTVARVRGPVGAPIVGYVGATPATAGRLTAEVRNNHNSSGMQSILQTLSGRDISKAVRIKATGNSGWR